MATCHAAIPPSSQSPTLLFLSFDTHARTTVLLLEGQQLLQHHVPGMVADGRTVYAGYVLGWVAQVTEAEVLLLDPQVRWERARSAFWVHYICVLYNLHGPRKK